MKRLVMKSLALSALMAGLFGLPLAAQEAADKPQEKLEHNEAEKAAMAEIRKLGGHVMELAQTDPHLEVAYHLTDGDVSDDHLKPLANMPLLVAVNFARHQSHQCRFGAFEGRQIPQAVAPGKDGNHRRGTGSSGRFGKPRVCEPLRNRRHRCGSQAFRSSQGFAKALPLGNQSD